MASIVRDEDVRSGDPRIEGTRVAVLDVKRRVIDGSEDSHVVAGEYDVPMADLFRALAYYYDHRDEFESRQREAAATRREGEQATKEVLDDESGEIERSERAD